MNAQTRDLTTGKPLPLLVSFSLPLMIGNVFQQMYTVVDTAVVGKALGVGALAALGAADWLNWMMLGVIQGLTQGFGIMMAQNFGSRQMGHLRRTIGASAVLSAISALVLVALGQVAVVPILGLLQTPDAIKGNTVLYLRIMFGGVPIVMAYNLFAGMIRSLGDSKTPLYAMIVASCINISLDLLFVLVFHWGIAGAAVATLIAQVFAAGYCLWHLRKIPILNMQREDFRLDWSQAGQLLQLGFPMAFQNAIISVGGMIVQSVVNGFGMIFIAGFTATNKLYGILEIAATSYGYAMISYVGQNLGARKIERIRAGQRAAIGLAMATSCIIAAVMIGFGRWIVGCFISGTPQEVEAATQVAYRYLVIMSGCLPVLYVLHVTRSCVQGMGNTVLPMLSGVSEFVMRTGAALLLPMAMGQAGIFYAEVLAWAGADLILVPSYFVVSKRCRKNLA
ncbi:MAG: MATE family efflux transporter [Oscillospiraceae bacterium]|nr:MATE family efflux transporter [Bacillota bacterium]